MLSTDYTTEDTENYSSSSPSEGSGAPFTYQLNSIRSSDSDDDSDDESEGESDGESDSPVAPTKTQKFKGQQHKAQKQKVTGIASTFSKEEAQKHIIGETVNNSKDNKKAQKQNVAGTLSTPSSLQKSAKKVSQHWSPKDEVAFFHGLLSYAKGGKGLPSNLAPVYDYVRPLLDIHYNNSQLYNKFRWGRNKFHSIRAKIEVNNYSFQKNKYEFDNPHIAALYNLWMQIWGGEEDKGGDEHCNHVEQADNASVDKKVKQKKKNAETEAGNASVYCNGKKKKHLETKDGGTHKIRSEDRSQQEEEDKGGDEHGNHVEQAGNASINRKGKKKKHAEADAGNTSVHYKEKKKMHSEAEDIGTLKIRSEQEEDDKGGDEHGNHVEQADNVPVDRKRKRKKHAGVEDGNASLYCKGKKKKHDEAEDENTRKIPSEEEDEEEEDEEDVTKSRETLSHTLSKRKTRDVQISREQYNKFCEERDAALNELKSVVQKFFENTHSQVKAMLEGLRHQQ